MSKVLPASDRATVSKWLADHDKELFGKALPIAGVCAMIRNQLDITVYPRVLAKLRKEHCKYWGSLPAIGFEGFDGLEESEWDDIRRWAGKNMGALAGSRDINFIARLMASDGVKCNPIALKNSHSFMSKWKEARPDAN